MASEKVEVVFAANDGEIIKSYQKQNAALEKNIRKLQEASDKSKSSTREQKSGIDAVTVAAGAMGVAYTGVIAVVSRVTEANRKLIEQAHQVEAAYDAAFRKFQVQGNLSQLQLDTAQKGIVAVAQNRAVPVDKAAEIATQLVSSGFSADQASGSALDSALQVLLANNASGSGVDGAGLVQALAKFLEANGLDKNSGNLLQVGKQVQSLFQGTELQLTDLVPLAKQGGVLGPNLPLDQQLAAQSTLVTASTSPDQASEALKQIILKLTAQKDNQTVVSNLAKLGLNPDDVDLKGESFNDVLTRFRGGLAGVAEKDQSNVLKNIFGDSALAPFQILLNQQKTFNDNIALQQNTSGFDRAVKIASSGRNAATQRLQTEEDSLVSEYDDQSDLYRQAFSNRLLKAKTPPVLRDAILSGFDSLNYLYGTGPQQPLEFLSGGPLNRRSGEVGLAIESDVQQAKGNENLAMGLRLLEGILKATVENNPVNSVDTNRKRPTTPPSKALSR